MKRLALLLLIALLSVITFVTDSQDASAQGGIYVSQIASDAATDVVNGQIVSTISVVLDGEAHRVSEIEISGTEKGQLSGSILVEVPGGERPDGTVVFVSHTPELIQGELVQLAITPAEGLAGLAVAVGQNLEVFSVVGGSDGAHELMPEGVGRSAATGDYTLTGSSWPDFSPEVEFKVNPTGSGLSEAATIAGVQQAFEVWESDVGSDVDFTYGGGTGKSGVNLGDGQNVISWVNPPAGTGWLAQASWIANGDGDVLEFDVRISRNFSWSNGPASGKYDIGTVVGHEVGHGLGFGHAPASSELMYFQITSGATKGLGPGDRSGTAYLYPRQTPICDGLAATVELELGQSPTSGDDVIVGTSGADTIYALAGNDVICGLGGDDVIYAGEGDDKVFGGDGKDRVRGQNGNDAIYGGRGNDNLNGNNGDDLVSGGEGHDYVSGRDGEDRVEGGPGSDTVNGGGKSDVLRGGSGNDTMSGNGAADQLFGGNGHDVMSGGDGDDDVQGEGGDDIIKGNRDNDTLAGGSGFDDCDGMAGSDTSTGCETVVSVP